MKLNFKKKEQQGEPIPEIRDDTYLKKLKRLKSLMDIACAKGNYREGPYNHGLANGFIIAVAIMEGKIPRAFQECTIL